MFKRSLSALGGSRRRGQPVLGGRNILVPPKPSYPMSGETMTPLGNRMHGGRSSAAERRRKNLTKLALFIVATFVLGMVPALRFLLILNFTADIVLLLYLGLVVYMVVSPKRSGAMETQRVMDPALEPQRVAEGGL